MFSPALEIVLTVAYREATARRHTHLTLEHLLYALAHDPEGERILIACGADMPQLRRDLDKYLQESVEQFPRGQQKEPEQTLAFRRVLQTAVLHVQSAGRQEVHSGDVLAATLQQNRSHAAQLLAAQGITRLDVLEYITHGKSKLPPATPETPDGGQTGEAEGGFGERGGPTARDPLAAYATNLTARARNGELDPLIGRTDELQRTMEILCRRRKNNPVFVGDAGVGKTALAEGLAARLLEDDIPDLLEGAEVFSLDTGALLAGTRFRGDFEERFKAVIASLAQRPMPILFIDEIHSTVGAGATTGGTMDLATMIKPILTTGQLRVIGSTTHEEFKHIEKDRALARRLQKIVIDEPSIQETVQILQGLRSRYEGHHRVRYTDDALETAAKLAARHLRDYKLPDSAIDVLDEAGAKSRLKRGTQPAPDGGKAAEAAAQEPAEITGVNIEEVIARMARIPAKQASASDRDRLRSLEEALGRVVFGQEEAVGTVARAIKRARAGLGQPDRPAGCFLFTGPTGVGKTELAKQLALHLGNEFIRYDMSEYMEKHAVARLIGAPPGYVGFEQGGPARRRRAPASVRGRAPRRDREGASRHLQHPAAGDGPRDADRQQRPQGRLPPGRADPDLQRRIARDERRQHRLRRVGLGPGAGRAAEVVAAAVAAGGRARLQPRVPQPARRDRHLRPAEPGGDGDHRREVHPAARGPARRAPRRDRARAGGAGVAGREGLRSDLRRAAAGPRDPDRGSRSFDRRDPLRTARRAAAR